MTGLKHRSELTALNIVSAIAAAFLFVSPWLFGFAGETRAAWNAWVSGTVIGVLALAAVFELKEWEEWLNLAVGLWVAVSPWLLGFASIAYAMWSHVGVGIAVAVIAASGLWMIHNGSRATA